MPTKLARGLGMLSYIDGECSDWSTDHEGTSENNYNAKRFFFAKPTHVTFRGYGSDDRQQLCTPETS